MTYCDRQARKRMEKKVYHTENGEGNIPCREWRREFTVQSNNKIRNRKTLSFKNQEASKGQGRSKT